MITTSGTVGHTYEVGEKIGETENFTLYECVLPDKKTGILKIAKTIGDNGLLDKEAYMLRMMKQESDELENEYSVIKKGSQMLNYHFFFPLVVETYADPDQDNRRISILSFSHITDSLHKLVPISNLIDIEKVRVDPRTSVWIMGRLLKMLCFTTDLGIRNNVLEGENILLNKKDHHVSIFDWTQSALSNGPYGPEVSREEIMQVAKHVQAILGANESGVLPASEQLVDDSYQILLQEFAEGKESLPKVAHAKFYKLVDALWPREYYPFTTHKL